MKATKKDLHESGRVLTQEEFINKIKTDDVFANKWGELGPIYGKQWRKWGGVIKKSISGTKLFSTGFTQIDQIANSINLLRTDPDSRRNRVSAWNVGELDSMVLPPCHTDFQFYTRELTKLERRSILDNMGIPVSYTTEHLDKKNIPTRAISLMWNQRSVDTFLGLPFNIASYGLLLEIIAKEVNMVPDELIGNLGDVHLYSNHIEQAKEQIGREMTFEEKLQWVMRNTDVELENLAITEAAAVLRKRTREPFPLPKLNINTEFWKTQIGECGVGPLDTNLQGFEISDFKLENYQAHPIIKALLSN